MPYHYTQYHHTQSGPWYLLLIALSLMMLIVAAIVVIPAVQWILELSGYGLLILSAAMCSMTIEDGGTHLLVMFGPLHLFRRRILYEEIKTFKRGRITWLEGWGIHTNLRGRWTWNIWGFECVELSLTQGRTLRLGTDDLAGLETMLKERVTGYRPPNS